jgi:hypothetical protein
MPLCPGGKNVKLHADKYKVLKEREIMKTQKYCLIVSIITGILCNIALSEVVSPPEKYEPLLIGRANPALAGIDNLHVTIIYPAEEPNGLLKAQINNKLSQAGIKVFSPEPGVMYKLPTWPELQIRVDMLKLEQSQQADSADQSGVALAKTEAATSPREGRYVFHIQTLLAKNIHIQLKPALRQKADVWKAEPVMQAVSAENMPDKVTEVVLKQVDSFIEAWRAANPADKQISDANEISIVPKEQIKPAIKESVSENKPVLPALSVVEGSVVEGVERYVASKNSSVFHKSTCTWATKIKPENLVHYKTRDDAINAGKKPCKQCEP